MARAWCGESVVSPPRYEVSRATSPIAIFYSHGDSFISEEVCNNIKYSFYLKNNELRLNIFYARTKWKAVIESSRPLVGVVQESSVKPPV